MVIGGPILFGVLFDLGLPSHNLPIQKHLLPFAVLPQNVAGRSHKKLWTVVVVLEVLAQLLELLAHLLATAIASSQQLLLSVKYR